MKKKRVKIVSLPKGQSGLEVRMNLANGFNTKELNWPVMLSEFSKPPLTVAKTLEGTSPENANLEAEKGETVVTDLNHDGIPQHFTIGGKRHYEGGTPLNLPPDSFIFSRDKKMKIKDEDILKMFGKNYKKGGYTPADIAKQYDINKYRKVLADPDTDDLQRKTAEMMIANYNLKLGKLALAQESLKGFPQGIPEIAMPYLEMMDLNPAEFVQTQGEKTPVDPNMAKYGKEVKSMRRVRIISTPKAQTGGTPVKKQVIPEGASVIKRSDYDSDEEYVRARNKAFRESQGKPIYTQAPDGKYYVVGNKPRNLNQDQHLELLNSSFSDPQVQQNLYNYTLEAAKNPQNKGRNMGFTVDELKKMTPAELTQQFLEMQNRNIRTGYQMEKQGISYDCFDNTTGKRLNNANCKDIPYASLDDMFEKTGVGAPKDAKSKGLQQAAYIGYRDMLQDRDKGKIGDPHLMEALSPFRVDQFGVNDETGPQADKRISKIDTYYTNTTSGQMAGIVNNDIGETLVPEEELKAEEEKRPEIKHMGPGYVEDRNAPWWLQDIIKTAGAAGDYFRIQKHMPWQATPNVYLPEAVFYDPNRELAANAEQANIMAQNLGAFAGPKLLSARTSQIQGQSAKNAADILGRYNNMNVGVANQLDMAIAQILNQASANRAGLATQLYDKNVIANQQFENAKNQVRQNLRQSYIDAITNKEMTYNLNQLFPQYAIHPEIGGGIEFTQGRPVKPDNSGNTTMLDKFREYKHQLPGTDDATVWGLVKGDMGQSNNASWTDPNFLALMQANMSGMLGQ